MLSSISILSALVAFALPTGAHQPSQTGTSDLAYAETWSQRNANESCVGACGGPSAKGSCWCDDQCVEYNDCCRDYQKLCTAAKECTRYDDSACAVGEYCKFDLAAECGLVGKGRCEPLPQSCEFGGESVCGCDGHNYQNRCTLAKKGVSIAGERPCPLKRCGRFEDQECGSDEYCHIEESKDLSCGWTGQTGHCKLRPTACSMIYAPVCGCDGKKYSDACDARGSGVPVAFEGQCGVDGALKGERCGGIEGRACSQGLYCKPRVGTTCAIIDKAGTCTEIRPCSDEIDEVCGCNGETYDNECMADEAGVHIAKRGPCEANEEQTASRCDGPYRQDACGQGEYCDYPAGDFCGLEMRPARCTMSPKSCLSESKPVCGCDQRTYANACEARRAGVDVLFSRACS